MKDQEIILKIQNGEHDNAIKILYKEFPKIKTLIVSSGGNKTQARENFHDSLILLIEKVSSKDFKLTSKLSTYLYGINRLLWKNKLRKKNNSKELEWSDTLILTNEDLGIEEEKESRIQALESVLKKISDRCREIFSRFYFHKETMSEIANAMSFSSVNSAKTQKYKCIEQAIRISTSSNLKNA